MKALIGYQRISTENQKDGFGLRIQEAEIKRYAKENNYDLIKIFSDEAVSGALKDRPALIELMNFAEANRKMGLTLAFLRLDRLARDLLLQENLISDFQGKGLEVISIDEPDLCEDDHTRKLFRQMKGMISEYEKSVITLRMSAGRLKKVESGGGYAGGNVCYGFRVENGGYRQVNSEIKVVKAIARLRRKPKLGRRTSFQKIADSFNKECIPSPMGGKWYAMTVRYVANNEFYRGIQHYSSVKILNPELKVL